MTLSHTAGNSTKFAEQNCSRKSWKTTTIFLHFQTSVAETHDNHHILLLNFSMLQLNKMIPKNRFIHSHSFNIEIELIYGIAT